MFKYTWDAKNLENMIQSFSDILKDAHVGFFNYVIFYILDSCCQAKVSDIS